MIIYHILSYHHITQICIQDALNVKRECPFFVTLESLHYILRSGKRVHTVKIALTLTCHNVTYHPLSPCRLWKQKNNILYIPILSITIIHHVNICESMWYKTPACVCMCPHNSSIFLIYSKYKWNIMKSNEYKNASPNIWHILTSSDKYQTRSHTIPIYPNNYQ